ISLNALKNQEAPSQNLTSPTGFTAEDLCQMAYYAGRSEMNEILSIYDYVRETHDNTLTVNLLATVIWYFMHGLNLRTPMGLPVEADLQKFIIEHKIDGKKLTFLKDEREQKWWLSSPYFKANLTHSMPLISCDYYDYQLAANEQMLSDRLIGWFDLYEKSGESQDVLKANTS
ncbi:MAG: hypothetical protein HKN76_09175, partial [Saprospiraceae bacterium]|nr:hypothetical protein [Saprospiraceae bacterium]